MKAHLYSIKVGRGEWVFSVQSTTRPLGAGEECPDEGGRSFHISKRVSPGVLVSLGIWGFAMGKLGAYEERGMNGVVCDGLGNCVHAGIYPADADVGGWEGEVEEVGLEGGLEGEDATSGVAGGGDGN